MINAVVGKPGAGKSYEAVDLCRRAIEEQGRVVVTNLPLKLDHEFWQDAQEAGLLQWHKAEDHDTGRVHFAQYQDWVRAQAPENMRDGEKEGQKLGPLIVIDEIGTCFAAMEKDTLNDVRVLLSKHRHSLADYYFVVQSHTHMELEVKPLVESWVELSSMKKSGLPGYRWLVFSTWYGQREPLSQGVRRYDKRRFALYDSHALGAGSNYHSDETTTLYDRVPVYLKLPFLMLYVVLLASFYLVPAAYQQISGVVMGEHAKATSSQETPDEGEQSDTQPEAAQDDTTTGQADLLRPEAVNATSVLDYGIPPGIFNRLGAYRGASGTIMIFENGSMDMEELLSMGVRIARLSACDVVFLGDNWRYTLRCR